MQELQQTQKWPDLLVIVRHGQSVRNLAKEQAKASGSASVWGSSLRDVDTPLTPVGVQQAVETGKFLRGKVTFDVIFSSPYMRTLQTSGHIAEQLGSAPKIMLEERIREIEFGILDGLTQRGIKERHPDEWTRREREGKYWYRPPGGESRPDVALRVHSFLGTLTRDFQQKKVLVVCHSVVVLIFRRLLERWDESKYLEVDLEDEVLNCGITTYKYDSAAGRLRLDGFNTVCYR
jgi:probable phosphoglycerate mutase